MIVTAIEAGYRHIDTAYRYGNQRGVGQGIRDSGMPREELFVTTKLDGEFQGDDRAIAGLDECLRQLGLDYVDLLLIHWPLPQRDSTSPPGRRSRQLVAAGKARSIGVSNFKPAHLDRLFAEATIRPAVNQIQLNPRITRPEQRAYDREHDIVTVAWSPLGARQRSAGGADAGDDRRAKYGKTPGAGRAALAYRARGGGDPEVVQPRAARPEHRHLRLRAHRRRGRRHLGARHRRGCRRQLGHVGTLKQPAERKHYKGHKGHKEK